MHFTICFAADVTGHRSLALLTYGYWLGKREGFLLFLLALWVQFNPEKLEIGKRMKKVLAETHTGSQLPISERNRNIVQCFLF